MREILFMIACVWAIVTAFAYGIKFIRKHHNYLLGLEWLVMGTSCTNFLVFAAIKGSHDSVQYTIAEFFDAFSRSIGMTLILVMGLMRVTHRYTPSLKIEIGTFAFGIVVGALLTGYQDSTYAVPAAIFFIVATVITTGYLIDFSIKLWRIGERGPAVWAGIATFLSLVVVVIYDTVQIPGDDAERTLFYSFALATWGLMMFAYYRAYDAFDAHNKRVDAANGQQTTGAHV
ncbi:MAG: transporter [Rhodococcus sp. (in: high G+C Gram-positive bacteria)]